MTREEIMDNLGTIAKSGSQEFMRKLQNGQGKADSQQALDSIIGQFGVGFYSTFIVADSVEVLSKNAGAAEGVRWVSDGSGEYEVSTVENLDFARGTRITLKLKAESREFAREAEIDKILRKYSLFITYPIKLNGQLVNNLQAIWYRDKREVTEDEYERFFEHLANTKIPYKFKLHYSTDVPLTIKALFFIPAAHSERMGMMQETPSLHLYCRKVLIKEKCQELLPGYLRFVKGVVDCEDLPLNISRETYQDSALIAKLRNVVTRRVLKMLEDEMKRDPVKFDAWFADFNQFLKEGLMMDSENKEPLLKLMRYHSTFQDGKEMVGLDDYVKKMKAGQQKIYYVTAATKEMAMQNPFMEPFRSAGAEAPPVLILVNNVDEVCLQQIGEYRGHRFTNIETAYEEISKDIGPSTQQQQPPQGGKSLPEEDVVTFSLWLKNELQKNVGKVTISKRLRDQPAILYGQMSSSMRMVMSMMEQSNPGQMEQMNKNNTLEINPSNPIIIKLNELRKRDPKKASPLAQQLLENLLLQAGIPFNLDESTRRNLDVLNDFLINATGRSLPEGKEQ